MSNKDIVHFLENKRRKFEFSHQVIVQEEGKSLYNEPSTDEAISSLDQYNGKMLTVITSKLVDDDLYYLLNGEDGILGWFQPEKSIEVYKKKKEPVSVDFENYVTPPIHKVMNIKGDMNLAFKGKKLTSNYWTIYEDELYEALYARNRFIGWAHTSALLKTISFEQPRIVNIEDIEYKKVYEDVQLTGEVDWHFDAESDLKLVAYSLGGDRFQLAQNDREAWISMPELGDVAGIESIGENSNEEILMDDLLYSIEEERQQSKNNMVKLIKETFKYRKEIEDLQERNRRMEERYNNLKASKLGRLQTKIWERKKKRRGR